MNDEETLEANKALIRRWFEEVWNQGRADAIDEMLAVDGLPWTVRGCVKAIEGSRRLSPVSRCISRRLSKHGGGG